VVVADTVETVAHEIEGVGEGERLVERFFQVAAELEDAMQGGIGFWHGRMRKVLPSSRREDRLLVNRKCALRC